MRFRTELCFGEKGARLREGIPAPGAVGRGDELLQRTACSASCRKERPACDQQCSISTRGQGKAQPGTRKLRGKAAAHADSRNARRIQRASPLAGVGAATPGTSGRTRRKAGGKGVQGQPSKQASRCPCAPQGCTLQRRVGGAAARRVRHMPRRARHMHARARRHHSLAYGHGSATTMCGEGLAGLGAWRVECSGGQTTTRKCARSCAGTTTAVTHIHLRRTPPADCDQRSAIQRSCIISMGRPAQERLSICQGRVCNPDQKKETLPRKGGWQGPEQEGTARRVRGGPHTTDAAGWPMG